MGINVKIGSGDDGGHFRDPQGPYIKTLGKRVACIAVLSLNQPRHTHTWDLQRSLNLNCFSLCFISNILKRNFTESGHPKPKIFFTQSYACTAKLFE